MREIKSIITTQSGYARLQARLKMTLDAYDAVCATNAYAAGDGDNSVWHDNFAYEHNQREMHKLARQVNDIKKILAVVKIIEITTAPKTAQVGCAVVLRDEKNNEWCFKIAGYEDGNIACVRVSYTTPLMKKIIGKAVGDTLEFFIDNENRRVTIVSIQLTEENENEQKE